MDKILFIAPISSVHSSSWIKGYPSNQIRFEWLSPYDGEIPHDVNIPCRRVSLFELFFAIRHHQGIIHIHYIAKILIPLIFISRKKFVLTFWGSDFERIWNFRLFFLIKFLSKRNSLVITTDAVHIIERINRLSSSIKVHLLNFGRDLDKFKRKSYKDNYNSKKFVSCRNFDPLYDVDLVLKSFVMSGVWKDNWKLDVFGVGSQSDTERIIKLIKSLNADCLGAICYLGKLTSEQVVDLYNNSAFHISASTRDGGLSAAVAEGMLCGSVPIISDSVDNLLWVTELEGLFFQTGNANALTKAIAQAASMSLMDFIGKSDHSYMKIAKNSDRDIEIKKCITLYQSI